MGVVCILNTFILYVMHLQNISAYLFCAFYMDFNYYCKVNLTLEFQLSFIKMPEVKLELEYNSTLQNFRFNKLCFTKIQSSVLSKEIFKHRMNFFLFKYI